MDVRAFGRQFDSMEQCVAGQSNLPIRQPDALQFLPEIGIGQGVQILHDAAIGPAAGFVLRAETSGDAGEDDQKSQFHVVISREACRRESTVRPPAGKCGIILGRRR